MIHALKAGETATVTLVFSEAVSGFSSSDDITVVNGSLTTMTSSDNITWTGTYTPTTDVEDTSNVLTLATTYTDSAGNTGPSATTSNFEIDTKYPTVSSFTLSDTSLKVGETATVTLVFSEVVSGFSSSDDITVVNGSLTTMTSSDNITWTGTYTPSTDVEDTSNILTLATTYTDSAGNTGPSATTSNFEIDTKYPTVSSFTLSDSALKAGETATVTLVFSEAVSGFSSSDDITVVNGSLSTMTSSDNITWSGTYTPSTDVEDTSNVLTLATTYTDSAGNAGPSATTSNFEIDTKYPTVSSFTLSDTSLKGGETATVTLVFSEAVSGFSSSDDITVVNGSLTTMTSSDNITWTGTYTPSTDVEDTSNVLTLATTYTDSAGNAGPSATTSNFEIDTKYPTVSSFTLSDSALKAGETATVTLVFSRSC